MKSLPPVQPRAHMQISQKVKGYFCLEMNIVLFQWVYYHCGPAVFLSSTVHGNSRSHMILYLRNKFTHRNLHRGHWPFFSFRLSISHPGCFLGAFLKKNKIKSYTYSYYSPLEKVSNCFTNFSQDETRSKESLRESAQTKWQEASGAERFTTSSFRLTWESSSPSTFWHCGVTQSSLASVDFSPRPPAATCLFATRYFYFCHSRCSLFFSYQCDTRKVLVKQSVTHFCKAADVRKPQP